MIRRTGYTKFPSEDYAVTISFVPMLKGGETVVSATCTVRNARTGEDVSGLMAPASPTLPDAQTVACRIQAGVEDNLYVAQVVATTSAGNKYEHWIDIDVPAFRT